MALDVRPARSREGNKHRIAKIGGSDNTMVDDIVEEWYFAVRSASPPDTTIHFGG